MKSNLIKATIIAGLAITAASCSKLDSKLNGSVENISSTSSGVAPLLKATYDAFRQPYQDQSEFWAAQEHTSDEACGPTRGGDWDDNGIWRVLHSHKWDADHAFLRNTYNSLGKIIFNASDILKFSPTPQQEAEARFLRAFATLSMVDGWDQAPYREPGGNPLDYPKVRKGAEAIDWVISEVNAAMPNLPVGPSGKANKNAAKVLLMKCYLNKAVYTNRATPTFAPADMNQVILLADQLITSGTYSLSANYFDNFAPNNDAASTELIFTNQNLGGAEAGNMRSRWFCTLHYNQNPSGWNGFTTLGDFYNKFEAVDKRRGGNAYPGMNQGVLPGFLIGQQFTGAGVALKDRKGNPLVFTPAVALKETGNNLEVTGIRVVKYPIDYVSGDNSNNDYVFYRYSDVLLMKAEAILRGGAATAVAPTTALALVNAVRTAPSRAATPLASVSLDQLIDERGREFYWEGVRRTDLVRFGKFLLPNALKAGTSDSKYLVFPIPNQQLAVNPNLTQNPGY
jgi:starch-binding outer membrane protein, SusD/RagB family